MNKIVKIFIWTQVALFGFIIAMFILFYGKVVYEDNLTAQELLDQSYQVIETEGGIKHLDSDAILEITDEEIPNLKDYSIIKANNVKNINEIGIFRMNSTNNEEFIKEVQRYVEEKKQIYRALDYFPQEVNKIDNATVRVYGNYIMYSFLNEEDTLHFYKQAENLVKK